MKDNRRRRPGEAVFGYLLLALSLFLLYQAYAISGFSSLSSAGAYPMAAALFMTVSSIAIILGNRRMPKGEATTWREAARLFSAQIVPARPFLVYVGLIVGFMVLLVPLGFIPAALLFLLFSFWYLFHKGFVFALVTSGLSVAAVYAIFRLVFKVVLPEMDWLDAVDGTLWD